MTCKKCNQYESEYECERCELIEKLKEVKKLNYRILDKDKEIAVLEERVRELEEYKFKYDELCK